MSLVGLLIVLLGLGVGVWVGVIMKIGLPDTWKTERWWPLGECLSVNDRFYMMGVEA